MASSSNNADGDFGFQIAPMVDVVFVLLLFFMACAGLRQVEKHLSINTASRGAGTDPALFVDIAADGAVSVNGQLLAAPGDESLARLQAWFDRMPPEDIANSPLVIRPTADVPHGRFVRVLATLNKKGFRKIAFG